MDTNSKLCYSSRHETPWNQSTTGNQKTSSNRAFKGRENLSIRRRHIERLLKFSGAVVPNPSEERTEGIEIETDSRTPPAFVRREKERTETTSPSRPCRRRIQNKLMDAQTHWSINSKTFRRPLSHGSRLETDDTWARLELAKTGTSSHPAGRKGHPKMENANLATYKKTLGGSTPTWLFLTKAVSCSRPTSEIPGLLSGKRLLSDTVISAIKFPPFPVSRPRRAIDAWDSTCNFI